MAKFKDGPPGGAYEVGRGKPPKHSQFKKGVSGNPKGRPTKSKNANVILEEALDEVITVREGDRLRKLTKREVTIQAIVTKAMKGDPRAFAALFGSSLKPSVAEEAADSSLDELAPADEEILADFLRRNGFPPGSPPAEPDGHEGGP